eukprot:scaffold5322_cov59-Phaeocystis_antarctica.AAC.3
MDIWCILKAKFHNRPPSTTSRRVKVLEHLAPCVERVASEGGVVLLLVRDQLLDMVRQEAVAAELAATERMKPKASSAALLEPWACSWTSHVWRASPPRCCMSSRRQRCPPAGAAPPPQRSPANPSAARARPSCSMCWVLSSRGPPPCGLPHAPAQSGPPAPPATAPRTAPLLQRWQSSPGSLASPAPERALAGWAFGGTRRGSPSCSRPRAASTPPPALASVPPCSSGVAPLQPAPPPPPTPRDYSMVAPTNASLRAQSGEVSGLSACARRRRRTRTLEPPQEAVAYHQGVSSLRPQTCTKPPPPRSPHPAGTSSAWQQADQGRAPCPLLGSLSTVPVPLRPQLRCESRPGGAVWCPSGALLRIHLRRDTRLQGLSSSAML